MVAAAILAGGRGRRLGGDVPKQFLELAGETVLTRCVRAFAESGLVDLCLVCVPADHTAFTGELLRAADLPPGCPVHVTAGGESRSDTLKKALLALRELTPLADCILLTHDAVRPFATKRMIADNIAAAREYGACGTGIPATDTIYLCGEDGFVDSVPVRSRVFHAQTPQSFRAAELLDLIEKIPPADFEALTDGCSVYAYFQKRVYVVPGDRDNIKITYPEDMEKAREILKRRARQ